MARLTKKTQDTQRRAEKAAAKIVVNPKTGQRGTNDSFQNFALQLGMGTANALSASTYGFNPITRMRTILEWIYRGSWLGGMAVDVVADDMTRAGVEILADVEPDQIDLIQKHMVTDGIWEQISDLVKNARLYGGAVSVFLVDGQKLDTPLNLDTVQKGRFKGLLTLDRWMCEPVLNDLVTELGPDLGMPQFYRVTTDAPAFRGQTIHYTRLMRMVGIKMPYWQRISENLWGISVIERMYDRMVAFDSTTQGAAQLVFKSFLRTYKIKGLREAISTNGPAAAGIVKFTEFMRLMQSNEGITLLDGEDDFAVHSSTGFTGVSDVILQMAQQVSGALQIPLTRLLGQSPAGLNSTGESDLRTYYDGIAQQQEKVLRVPMGKIIRMIAQSEGIELESEFTFNFRPLWQLTEDQKSQVAQRDTETTLAVKESGLISDQTTLKELKQQSRVTGRMTNITDEDIDAADDEVAPDPAELGIIPGEEGGEQIEGANLLQKKLASPAGGGKKSPLEPKGPKEASDAAPEWEVRWYHKDGNFGAVHFVQALTKEEAVKISRQKFGDKAEEYTLSEVTRDSKFKIVDSAGTVSSFAGLPLVIETKKGAVRSGETADGQPWSVVMPCDYGYFEHTGSAEDTDGRREELDCFVGPQADSRHVFVVDVCDPVTGAFDEHKVMLGFGDSRSALSMFRAAYDDGSGGSPADRVMGCFHTSLDSAMFRTWLKSGDMKQPMTQRSAA